MANSDFWSSRLRMHLTRSYIVNLFPISRLFLLGIFIGPFPGAGKTSAFIQSGLRFWELEDDLTIQKYILEDRRKQGTVFNYRNVPISKAKC